VKIFDINLIKQVEVGTYVEEIYQRVAQWLNLDPRNISLTGRMHPNSVKVRNISPKTIVRNIENLIKYVKVDLNKLYQNNLKKRVLGNDLSDLKRVEIDGNVLFFNKFLNVRAMKKILMFQWEISNQWAEIYDAGNGMNYVDGALIKDIGEKLVIMWILLSDKSCRIGIDGTLKFKFNANTQISLMELKKSIRKECGLGKDVIVTDEDLNVFDNNDHVWNRRKILWLCRYRSGIKPKAEEIKDVKIIVEWNGVEIIVDGKIYTLWNMKTFNYYLSMLTGLKRREFSIWINGTEWRDKLSIGEKNELLGVVKKIDNNLEEEERLRLEIVLLNESITNSGEDLRLIFSWEILINDDEKDRTLWYGFRFYNRDVICDFVESIQFTGREVFLTRIDKQEINKMQPDLDREL
jgi:hypothetical protein